MSVDGGPCPHGIVASALPDDVVVVEAVPSDRTRSLHPSERDAVDHAVQSRRNEFSTGRACAREALRRLGLPPTAIPSDEHRAPVWPAGIVGSLTHTRRHCAAALALSTSHVSIGIDVELDVALEESLFDQICTPEELLSFDTRTEPLGVLVALAFSAKECFYKCQYPLTGTMLDFHDVAIDLDLEGTSFLARCSTRLPGLSRALAVEEPLVRGRVARCCGLLATGIALARPPTANGGRALSQDRAKTL